MGELGCPCVARTKGLCLSSPVQTGEGDRALARWKGRLTQRFIVVEREIVEADAPSTILRAARYEWSPFPAIAGQDDFVIHRVTPAR